MENKEIPDPDLKDVSSFLREQAELCHAITKDVRDTFYKHNTMAGQEDTLRMMTKLIAATATAAGAISRLKGTQINQTIQIQRSQKQAGEGASPETANGTMPFTHSRIDIAVSVLCHHRSL